ncbi:MAG TPA: hypothetical protein VIN09_04110, partial [Chloroflexota bacterium]
CRAADNDVKSVEFGPFFCLKLLLQLVLQISRPEGSWLSQQRPKKTLRFAAHAVFEIVAAEVGHFPLKVIETLLTQLQPAQERI